MFMFIVSTVSHNFTYLLAREFLENGVYVIPLPSLKVWEGGITFEEAFFLMLINRFERDSFFFILGSFLFGLHTCFSRKLVWPFIFDKVKNLDKSK